MYTGKGTKLQDESVASGAAQSPRPPGSQPLYTGKGTKECPYQKSDMMPMKSGEEPNEEPVYRLPVRTEYEIGMRAGYYLYVTRRDPYGNGTTTKEC